MTTRTTTSEDLLYTSALELARLIASRRISPVELLDSYLARIERINPRLLAYVTVSASTARAVAAEQQSRLESGEAVGPFAGVPLPIKDANPIAGIRTTFSHKAFADYIPTSDPSVMRRLRAAGFVIIGKTNAPEFGLLATTESELNGVCRNPWNTDSSPGGSSGGAAAAVAAGLAPAAHGGDGGGSIRIPAALCGLYGLKPSRGRISRGPAAGDVLHGFATDGPLTHTVADAAAILDVMAGYETGDPYWAPPNPRPFLVEARQEARKLRVGVCVTAAWPAPIDAECIAALTETSAALQGLGHQVKDVRPRWENASLQADLRIIYSSLGAYWMPTDVSLMEPHTQLLMAYGSQLKAHDYIKALIRVQTYARKIVEVWDDFDVVLMPTTTRAALPIGWLLEGGADPYAVGSRQFEFIAFTVLANITGQPAASVPVYWTPEGLPVGVQIVGRPGDEATLLQVSAQLEAARPWAHRRPPLT